MLQSWTMEPDSGNMSKSDILRGIITEKLSAAAREILAVVERTVADYEEEATGFRQEVERQRRLLELLQPEIKLEADDQQVFYLCEAGGGQLPEDDKQEKYGLSLEDSESLGYQAPIEENDRQYFEQEEEHTTELDYEMASRLFRQTVQTKRKRRKRHPNSDPTRLRICILENSKIRVVSRNVYNKYPTQMLKVPHCLREDEFLDLLKSTFPQLAKEPFRFFYCRRNRKLKPLNIQSVTPEEFESVYGSSTLYIRLQKEDADEDLPSTLDTISHNTRVTADGTTPTSHPLTETDTHKNLTSHVLEDPKVDMSSPIGLEDCESLGYQAPIEEDDCLYLEQEEEHTTELDYGMASRLVPQTVQTKRKRMDQRPSNDPIHLSIRILENSKIKVASNYVYRKYPLQKLKVPRGLQKADFLELLKSTFPQLADEPFHLFFCGKHRKLKPLNLQSVTPEEINRLHGNSTVYIRLQRENVDEPDEDPPSTLDTTSHSTRVTADETTPTSHPLTETDTHINLKSHVPEDPQVDMSSPIGLEDCESLGYQAPIEEDDCLYLEQEEEHMTELDYGMASRLVPQTVQFKTRRKDSYPSSDHTHLSIRIRILENSKINVVSKYVCNKYPLQDLKVPRGLQEVDFLELLKSIFPQLADEPFHLFFCGKHKKLKPLNLQSVTPEEINRLHGNSTVYIRLQREDVDEPDEDHPSTLDTISHSTRVTADETTSTETDTHINLKIYILEYPKVDMSSPIVFQNCPPHELQVPRGLQEADFLALLRSTFPQLAGGFTILTPHSKKLNPLRVERVTAEEIYRTSRPTGNPVIFIQLKGPVKTFPLREVGAGDPLSTPDRTTPNTEVQSVWIPPVTQLCSTSHTQITHTIKPLDEDLRCIILRVLPEISDDSQQALIDKLLSSGLKSTHDLRYVTQEDIGDLLPALQLQKILEAFKKETELGSTPSSVLPLSNQESGGSENCGQTALFTKHWTETFTVPWKCMPEEVQTAVIEGKRPSRAARRQMIKILVDKIRRYSANPSRSEFVIICQKLIRRYPHSFADLYDNNQLLGNGYNSLLGQIIYQNEKLNRILNTVSHHSSGKKPGLPPEETDETVEPKRQRLEEIYCQDGENVAGKDEVTELMKATFSLQRCQINALPAPAVRDLRDRWPHLFTQNGLYTHFELLTDIKVLRNLEVAMEDCGRAILELFSESTNPGVQAILSLGPNYELSFCVIQLLMAHFAEDLEGLILFADVSATAADVEKTFQLPASPRLILLAESPGSSIHHWMISLEGNVICEGIQPTFLSGLAAVFSTYYIFNLQYQDNAACTLEFIQRRFIGINPDKGTKGKFLSEHTGEFVKEKTTPINPQVLTLLNKLMDRNLAAYTHPAMFPSF